MLGFVLVYKIVGPSNSNSSQGAHICSALTGWGTTWTVLNIFPSPLQGDVVAFTALCRWAFIHLLHFEKPCCFGKLANCTFKKGKSSLTHRTYILHSYLYQPGNLLQTSSTVGASHLDVNDSYSKQFLVRQRPVLFWQFWSSIFLRQLKKTPFSWCIQSGRIPPKSLNFWVLCTFAKGFSDVQLCYPHSNQTTMQVDSYQDLNVL